LLESERSKLPPKETVFLVFDAFRWKVQLGIRESGGHMSLLNPDIDDDCMVMAWAPFGTAEDPDEAVVQQHCHSNWHEAINSNYAADGLTLLREWNILRLHLKGEYFHAIKAGTKPFEYRLASKWQKRLESKQWDVIHLYLGYPKEGDESRILRRKWSGFKVVTRTHPHFGPEPVEVCAIDVTKEVEP
jgi:hypothetical protein